MKCINPIRGRALLAVTLGVGLAAGCGGSAGDTAGSEQDPESGPPLQVVASFYPLEYIAQRLTKGRAEVTGLTPPGVESHDLELTPQDVGTVASSDLAIYLSGFQPAVDEAVEQEASDQAFDVRRAARLDLTYTPLEEDDHEHGSGHEAEGHEGEAHEESGAVDPHFWLDPTRLADVSDQLASRFAKLDPRHAASYRSNARALRADLEQFDSRYRDGLADCRNDNLVTSHNAFGYLADRYGLRQVGISGLTPEEEPAPRTLAEVTDFVRKNDVRTIYYETLVSPKVAETVASEAGVHTAVLDPLEGLTSESGSDDYFSVMRSNLDSLREGQSCS